MYEPEMNRVFESIDTLPAEIRERFAELRNHIVARTMLPWGEHCTECAWPTCYTTCELYSARTDGACRQFIDGMVRIDHAGGASPYLLKLRFKAWAKLWTVGNLRLERLSTANAKEKLNNAIGAISRTTPMPAVMKTRVLRKVNYLRRQTAEHARPDGNVPDCFLLECYNPAATAVDVTFTVRATTNGETQAFQSMIGMSPGYTRYKLPFADISRTVDMSGSFEVEIVPNGGDDTVLYFGLMDFIKEHQAPVSAVPSPPQGTKTKWKCIVWDLDNTLWDGTLIEDGPRGIRLRQDVVEVIRQTDQKGILHSIASKNNYADAMAVLRDAGIHEYFLYPQIQWQPKSGSIAAIAKSLNIGVEALAFVDDQEFERAEVKSALPAVAVVDAAHYRAIPDRDECQVPVTAESRNRRLMYQEQEKRETSLSAHGGDYLAFLRECDLRMSITPLNAGNLKRVYELAQRTNQMNYSGNRYPEEKLQEIMRSTSFETYVVDCADRFGHYGIVGFGVVDLREPRVVDLMFSCRIQSKRVEHALLGFVLKRFVEGNNQDLFANYRKTPKNAAAGKVFDDIGFECVAEGEIASLVFRKGRSVPDDQIVTIDASGLGAPLPQPLG
jgi:FkbH-like protein